MTKGSRVALAVMVTALLVGLTFSVGSLAAAVKIPKLGQPIVLTAPGQAPEYAILKVYLDRAKIPVKTDPLLEPKELSGKTLILIIGGSGKGLGAAGVDIEDEEKRAAGLIAKAHQLKMAVVGMHLGGEARRGANSQKFIELVTPKVDFVVVRADGNKDGVFTQLAAKGKVPLLVIEKNAELASVLEAMFK